MSMVCVFNYQP